jgi:hypothetical protein
VLLVAPDQASKGALLVVGLGAFAGVVATLAWLPLNWDRVQSGESN